MCILVGSRKFSSLKNRSLNCASSCFNLEPIVAAEVTFSQTFMNYVKMLSRIQPILITALKM